MRLAQALALCVTAAFGVLTTACTGTVDGTAVRAHGSVPADHVAPLDESALEDLLLSGNDLNKIAGVDMESFYTAEVMNDNAALVSDAACLGAVYPGEQAVYDHKDWSAIRDELLLEADASDDAHLVEQTVVLFHTHDDAVEFFDDSKNVWYDCAKAENITVEDGAWVPDDVQEVNERMISQKAEVSGTVAGICQHSMGVVSNLIVEGYSCDSGDHDDAEQIATQLLENAADQ
jgi:hypothetical protein